MAPNSDAALRLFFALWPSPAQRRALVAALQPAVDAAAAEGARPTPADNWHLTLCFLGEQPSAALPRLRAAAATVRAAPVSVTLAQLEYWSDSAVLCATPGATATTDAVHALAAQLARALDAGGISHDVKPFRTHLTLARKVHAKPRVAVTPSTLEFQHFALVESRPGRDHSIYSVVDSWHLYIE